jgi:anti-anti-sigma factor
MKIQRQNGTLTVQDVQELSAANARSFRSEICAGPLAGVKQVEIDLSQIRFVDGYGLGALAALHADLNGQGGRDSVVIRLLHPQPPVQQVLELARMHHIFEIVPRNGVLANGWSHRDDLSKAAEAK